MQAGTHLKKKKKKIACSSVLNALVLTAESQAGGRALGRADPGPVSEPASQGTKTGNEKSKQRASKQINKGRTAEKRRMTTRCHGEHIICVLNLMSSPHAGSLPAA